MAVSLYNGVMGGRGGVMGVTDTLKRTEVFLGLDDSDLDKIAALPSCREVSYQAG